MLKENILMELREKREFISGQDLCSKFGVSRTAVWKAVNKLKKEGYSIDAVRNRGYCLGPDTDVLNLSELKSALDGNDFIRNVLFYEKTDSTNHAAKERAETGEDGPLLIVADEQTSGRGRRGRNWLSPPGTGIWMTLMLRPDILPEKVSMLTLVTAIAVSYGIRNETGLETGIKWPNDIVCGGKKVCGILTEMSTDPDGVCFVVIGTGINANMDSFPEEIRQKASSLRMETGKTVCRAKIIGAVMKAFSEIYPVFVRAQSLKNLKIEYERHLLNIGKEVLVLDPAGEYRGIAEGISEEGELLVRMPDQTLRFVRSGEVSVRGIYGYV